MPVWPIEPRYGDIYVWRMLSSYRPGLKVQTVENALRLDPNAWYMMNLNSHCRYCFDHARKTVVGKDYKIVPASSSRVDREVASIYEEGFVGEIQNFELSLYAATEFMFLGTSWLYPNCERKLRRFGGNIPLEWLVPVNLKHVDRGRIQQYVDEDYRTYRKMYLPGTTPDGKKSRSWEWKTLDPDSAKALIFFSNSVEEWRNGFGHGFIDSIWNAYSDMIHLEGEMLNLAERFGQGFLKLKLDALSEGDETRTMAALQSEYEQVLKYAKARHGIVIRKEDELEVLGPSGQGFDILIREIDRKKNEILTLCLGATLNVQQSQVGSYAQSKTHENSAQLHARFARSVLENGITHGLFKYLWEKNIGNFARLGLAGGRPPRFLVVEDQVQDYEQNLRILQGAQALGMMIKKDEAYEMLGLTAPAVPESEEDMADELLEPVPANNEYMENAELIRKAIAELGLEVDREEAYAKLNLGRPRSTDTVKPPLVDVSHPIHPFEPIDEQDLVLASGAGYLDRETGKTIGGPKHEGPTEGGDQ